MMKSQILLLTLSACCGFAGHGLAQTPATQATALRNAQVKETLNFDNREDFEDARRGFIATVEGPAILNADGSKAYPLKAWDFLKQEAPATANPSLWRQSELNSINGLFEVVPGKIYQIRGFDLANMTFVRTDHGWIVIDVTTAEASAKAGYDLVKKHVGDFPVEAVILTHPHIDHYAGIEAIRKGAPNKDFAIIAPKGFLSEAQNENVMAGVAMGRRASYMYGLQLAPGATGNIGTGLGQTNASSGKSIAKPTDEIAHTGEKRTIDGLDMEFVFVPEAEAPVEIMIYFPAYKAFCTAEEVTHTMHNLLTLRGAKVRNGLGWSKSIDEIIQLYGDKTEVAFASHHWPTWGNERIRRDWEAQRDMYRYLHDQTLHLANRGLTPNEIAEQIRLPESLDTLFQCRGYYGTVSHNVKSQYQMYFGWFDGNPANLNPLPPAELGMKYVEAMGGGEQVMHIARQAYRQGDYRWMATLLNNLVFADPQNREARQLLADTYTQLGYQAESGPWRNFYLTGAQELLNPQARHAPKLVNAQSAARLETDMLLDFCAIQISGPKATGKEATVNLYFTDTREKAALLLKNGALNHRTGQWEKDAQASLKISKVDFAKLILGQTTLDELQQDQKANVQGETAPIDRILSSLEAPDPSFHIVEP